MFSLLFGPVNLTPFMSSSSKALHYPPWPGSKFLPTSSLVLATLEHWLGTRARTAGDGGRFQFQLGNKSTRTLGRSQTDRQTDTAIRASETHECGRAMSTSLFALPVNMTTADCLCSACHNCKDAISFPRQTWAVWTWASGLKQRALVDLPSMYFLLGERASRDIHHRVIFSHSTAAIDPKIVGRESLTRPRLPKLPYTKSASANSLASRDMKRSVPPPAFDRIWTVECTIRWCGVLQCVPSSRMSMDCMHGQVENSGEKPTRGWSLCERRSKISGTRLTARAIS